MIAGQDRPIRQFLDAWKSRRMHHAWLLAGPRGVGKATFARTAALRVLAEASGPPPRLDGLEVEQDHPAARLVAAGSHPDFKLLERLERSTGGLARNISVHQIRELGELFAVTASISPWRVIVIDSADDLEREAANALLKMLEEPPAHCLFFLVSHAPGRLLPTIRSRCRRLDFQALDDDAMASVLSHFLDVENGAELGALAALANGSVGRALQAQSLDLAPLRAEAERLMAEGDSDNSCRSALAQQLSLKSAAERYAAFLDLVPSLIAREAKRSNGRRRRAALDAYAKARETAALAPRLSMDPGMTVFQLGGILASVALKA